jgi:ferredoxin
MIRLKIARTTIVPPMPTTSIVNPKVHRSISPHYNHPAGLSSLFRNCIFPSNYLSFTAVRPYISDKQCKRCGECITICPYEVFRDEEEKVVVKFPEDCVECTACVESCPEQAIEMGD